MAENRQSDLFAPLEIQSGAAVAQVAQKKTSGGDLRHCAIGGSATALAPQRRCSGAASHPPGGGGAKSSINIGERTAQVRESLREASVRRSELQPSADAHAAALASARERLRELHDGRGMLIGIERERCLAMHDEILAASTRWGRQAREYREINAIIDRLRRELEDLTERKAA